MRLDFLASDIHPMLGELIEARNFDPETEIYECGSTYALFFEMAPMVGITGDQIVTLNSMFSEMELGKGFVQILNWASPAIEPAMKRWHDGQKGSPKTRLDGRMDLFRQAALGEKFGHLNWRLRHYRVFLAIIVPSSGNVDAIIEKLLKIKTAVLRTLEAIGGEGIIVPPNALLALYHELLAPNPVSITPARGRWSELEPIDEQLNAPDQLLDVSYAGFTTRRETGDDGAVSGEESLSGAVRGACFSVMRTPEEWHPGRSHELIGSLRDNYRNCPWPVLQTLTIRQDDMNRDKVFFTNGKKNRQANSAMRFMDPKLIDEARDWDFIGKEIQKDATLVRVLYQVTLFAPAPEAESAEIALRNLFESHGFLLRRENGFHLPALTTALPLGMNGRRFDLMKRQNRTRLMLRRNALTLAPIFGEWQGNGFASPAILLFTGRRGQPAGWTPWVSNGGFNCAIGGKTGAGKSVLLQEMVCGIHASGGSAVVIDKGESFINSCSMLGGSYITFDDAALRFNPFAMIDERAMSTNDGEYAPRALSMLASFCGALCAPREPLTQLQDSILVNAVTDVWREKGGSGRIDDVLDRLANHDHEDSVDLFALLQPYSSDGAFGEKLAEGCNIDASNRLVIFELKSLDKLPALRAGIMVLLGFIASEKMFRTPRDHRVGLIIDEAHDLLSGSSAGFVEEVARTARKYNGALITATQSIDDYFSNPSATIAWNQSEWRLLLQQDESSIAALEANKRINIDERLKEALRSLQPRRDMWSEMIVHGPFGWDITRLLIDRFTLSSMTTSGDDVAVINQLMKDGMDRGEAIRVFAERKVAQEQERAA